jgi:hypothetical protein
MTILMVMMRKHNRACQQTYAVLIQTPLLLPVAETESSIDNLLDQRLSLSLEGVYFLLILGLHWIAVVLYTERRAFHVAMGRMQDFVFG